MTYQLSLLDRTPVPAQVTATQALQWTVELAQRAEALGFHRYWLTEHHGSPLVAGVAPEILAAHLLARTSRIRIGSGGVMLQHYSPFKVAETFGLLASLAPGRVDLGIGRAPGGFPRTTRALQALQDPARKPDYAAQLANLEAFLTGTVPAGHPLEGAQAFPRATPLPERILLGGSPESAQLAARLGWRFCYAGHFNGDPATLAQSLDSYRQAGGHAPLLAIFALAAESQEEAEQRVGALRLIRLQLPNGQSFNLPNLEAAAEFARQSGVTDYRTEERQPHVVAGTPAQVHQALGELSARLGVQEFVIDTPIPDFSARLTSLELLARPLQQAAA